MSVRRLQLSCWVVGVQWVGVEGELLPFPPSPPPLFPSSPLPLPSSLLSPPSPSTHHCGDGVRVDWKGRAWQKEVLQGHKNICVLIVFLLHKPQPHKAGLCLRHHVALSRHCKYFMNAWIPLEGRLENEMVIICTSLLNFQGTFTFTFSFDPTRMRVPTRETQEHAHEHSHGQWQTWDGKTASWLTHLACLPIFPEKETKHPWLEKQNLWLKIRSISLNYFPPVLLCSFILAQGRVLGRCVNTISPPRHSFIISGNEFDCGVLIYVTIKRPSILFAIHILLGKFCFFLIMSA